LVAIVEAFCGTISTLEYLGSCRKDLDNKANFKLSVVQPSDTRKEVVTSIVECLRRQGGRGRRYTCHTDDLEKVFPSRQNSIWKGVEMFHGVPCFKLQDFSME
jgi:hypothetical protein